MQSRSKHFKLIVEKLSILIIGLTSQAFAAIPGAPTNPKVTAVAPYTAELTWSVNSADVGNILGFGLGIPNDFGSRIDNPSLRSWQWGACPGKLITMSVSAFNAEGSSATVQASLTMPQQLPGQIIGMAANASSPTQITLNFSSGLPCNLTGFKVERASSSSGPPSDSAYTEIASVNGFVGAWYDNTPLPNVRYYYRVRAFNALGVSSLYSPPDDAMISMEMPTDLRGFIFSTTQLYLAWDTFNQVVVTNFAIERRTATTSFAQIGTSPMNQMFFTDTLPGQGVYFYRVRGMSTTLGPSPYSAELQYNFGPPSAAPSNLTVTALADGLHLNWTDNANNELGTVIERSESGGAFTQLITKQSPLPPYYTYYDDHLTTPGITYSYKIFVTNRFGDSGYSNTASGSYGSSSAPQPPRNLRTVN